MDASIFLVLSRNNFLTSRVGPLNGEGVDAVDAINVNVLVLSGYEDTII